MERKLIHTLLDLERNYQDSKWGITKHSIAVWNNILKYYMNKIADSTNIASYIKEVIKLAAVCIAILENLDIDKDTILELQNRAKIKKKTLFYFMGNYGEFWIDEQANFIVYRHENDYSHNPEYSNFIADYFGGRIIYLEDLLYEDPEALEDLGDYNKLVNLLKPELLELISKEI